MYDFPANVASDLADRMMERRRIRGYEANRRECYAIALCAIECHESWARRMILREKRDAMAVLRTLNNPE